MDSGILDTVVDLKIKCRDLQREKQELASIIARQEYEDAIEEIAWLPPTEEDFVIHPVG